MADSLVPSGGAAWSAVAVKSVVARVMIERMMLPPEA
jgi:hypothetical protein